MLLHPTCEPIDLPIETMALVDHVKISAGEPLPPPFLHFHDVVELVLFTEGCGRFISGGSEFEITAGSIAIVPSMMYHEFTFDPGSAQWILIQIDPYLVERIAARTGHKFELGCVQASVAESRRLQMLASWLDNAQKIDSDAALVEAILALIITALSALPAKPVRLAGDVTTDIERFIPAIDHLRQNPGGSYSLKQAATLCNLSPAYFSRRFASVFGCGFADYVASYRLHLAARHVATTTKPFSSISYDLGFASPSHFAERYRARFGMTPREYRKRARELD